MNRIWLGVAAGLAVATAPAGAQEFPQTCSRGEDVRVIEVIAPGEIGSACDLRYTRDAGATVSVPYHANHSAAFCSERARSLAASLVSTGYQCAAGARALRGAVLGVDDLEGAPATSVASAPAPAVQTLAAAVQTAGPAVRDASAAAAPAVLEQPAPVAAPALETPSPLAHASGPTALTPASAPAPAMRGAPNAQPAAFSKFTAPAPEDLAIAEAPLVIAAADPEPESAEAAPGVRPTAERSGPAARPRPAADVIRAVLNAQAAAWNDGDLDDFMSIYWKSPDVRFVSGVSVTKGWQQTLNRYRERYGSGAALGRLGFDALDVQMLTEDVAVVVGRFNLARGGGRPETGVFTLVMQRFDGVWRIVHDHSVGDPAAATP